MCWRRRLPDAATDGSSGTAVHGSTECDGARRHGGLSRKLRIWRLGSPLAGGPVRASEIGATEGDKSRVAMVRANPLEGGCPQWLSALALADREAFHIFVSRRFKVRLIA